MGYDDAADPVTADDVRALARVAGLSLDPPRAEALAGALEADLRAIRRLRRVEVDALAPLAMPPAEETAPDAAGRGGA